MPFRLCFIEGFSCRIYYSSGTFPFVKCFTKSCPAIMLVDSNPIPKSLADAKSKVNVQVHSNIFHAVTVIVSTTSVFTALSIANDRIQLQ